MRKPLPLLQRCMYSGLCLTETDLQKDSTACSLAAECTEAAGSCIMQPHGYTASYLAAVAGAAFQQHQILTLPLFMQGMELLVDYDYVAIFDADFKPDPDFLVRERQPYDHCLPHAALAVSQSMSSIFCSTA